ncbi:MAG TPA: HD domain-containing protein [Candidatus Humimicrobiaceae bacterium]
MDRENAFSLVNKLIKNKNLIKHSLAVEAIMRDLALDLNKKNSEKTDAGFKMFDEEKWALAGLVHDIDYEDTADDPLRHSLVSEVILLENGFDEDVVYAVKVHNDTHGLPFKSEMDIALFASDPVSGLIVASALINTDKKIDSINTDFVVKRYREKSFAKGANRKQMLACEKLGYTLEEFLSVALSAMKKIGAQIGL